MKECRRCRETLPLDRFGTSGPGKLNRYCRPCAAAINQKNRKDAQYYRDAVRKNALKRRELVRNQKAKPCADCRIQYPYYVMQFDHRPEHKKEFGIGQGLGSARVSKARLLAEIAKCDIVCANCHASRTFRRQLLA